MLILYVLLVIAASRSKDSIPQSLTRTKLKKIQGKDEITEIMHVERSQGNTTGLASGKLFIAKTIIKKQL